MFLIFSYHRRLILPLLLLLAGGALWLAAAPPADAHTRVEVGPYAFIVGWMNEPVIVGERNQLIVEVRLAADETPVSGVEATLDAEVLFGTASFRSNINPTASPGLYTIEIYPTVRGQYDLRLFGAVGDTPVDETLEPEEVLAADRLQFPETEPSARELQRELQAQVTTLEDELRTARLLAYMGNALGLLGIAGGVLAMLRGRTRTP